MGVVRNLRQVSADDTGVDIAFRADVHAGLAQKQKAIPARWFYDTTGSALFEDITALPEYYPTRSETDLLTRHAADIAAAIGPGRAVVELGSGSSTKTPLLLDAIAPAAYVPVDISGDFLRGSAEALAIRFPGLPIYPVEADFTQRVAMPDEIAGLPKLGFFFRAALSATWSHARRSTFCATGAVRSARRRSSSSVSTGSRMWLRSNSPMTIRRG
jgi:L-histidine N-alpha-methyltransferase